MVGGDIMEILEHFQMYPIALIHNLSSWCERNNMTVILATPEQLVLQITEDNQYEIFSLCQIIRKMGFHLVTDEFPSLAGISFCCQDMGDCSLHLSFFHTSVLEFLVDYVQNSFSFIYDIQEYQTILKLLQHLAFYSSSSSCVVKDSVIEKYILYTFDKNDELFKILKDQFITREISWLTVYVLTFFDLNSLQNSLKSLDDHLELKKIRGEFH